MVITPHLPASLRWGAALAVVPRRVRVMMCPAAMAALAAVVEPRRIRMKVSGALVYNPIQKVAVLVTPGVVAVLPEPKAAVAAVPAHPASVQPINLARALVAPVWI